MKKTKHLGLHIDHDLHYKIKYIADYDGRSISGEVFFILRRYILNFEKKHGKIDVPEENTQQKD